MKISNQKKISVKLILLRFLRKIFGRANETSRKKTALIPRSFAVGLGLFFAFFLFLSSANIQTAEASDTATFLTDTSYDVKGRGSVVATNRITGANAYYFIDDFYWNSKNPVEQSTIIANVISLSNEFDTVIYPKMHQYYGSEWIPGIDGDNKIYILLSDIKSDAEKGSYGGYFSTTNEYPKAMLDEYKKNQLDTLEKQKNDDIAAGNSIDYYAQKLNEINSIFTNEKELLYLNINFIDKLAMKSYLAHEFQHMINWQEKSKTYNLNEEVWLNEALSEYAPTVLGYDNIFKGGSLESAVGDFNRNPSDSLTEWKNTNSDYSNVNVFMQYLAGRYGIGLLRLITSAPKTGIAAINEALQAIDTQANFNDVFSDWVVTNYFNGQTIQDKKYGYANPNLNYENLHISASSSFMVYSNYMAKNSTVKSEESIKDWSGKWYQFISSPILSVPNQTLKINIKADAPDARFHIPYVIENIGGALSLKNFNLQGNFDTNIYIENFGTIVKSVTLMPINEGKIFSTEEGGNPIKFSYAASLVASEKPSDAPAVSIKNISPNTSALGNRTLVTITGDNFAEGSTVKFGGVPATEVTWVDSKTIIAKAPPFYANTNVDVEVVAPNMASAIAVKSFAYLSQAQVRDGSLIRAQGDYKVYVVAGKYKRWIQNEKIFGFYNFKWSDVAEVTFETRDSYATSILVRADTDYKVYEIGLDGKKHHLDMSGDQFTASGRKWEMIFIINGLEKNSYRTGATVTK